MKILNYPSNRNVDEGRIPLLVKAGRCLEDEAKSGDLYALDFISWV